MHLSLGMLLASAFWICRWFDLPLWLSGLLMLPGVFIKGRFSWAKYISLSATVLGLVSLLLTSSWYIKLYPVIVNIILLIVFAHSLYRPPTVIEIFARQKEQVLSDSALTYIRKVTLAWAIFFLCNGLISLYTVFLSDERYWAIYTGLISYLLIGFFFLIELIIRKAVMKQHV